MWNFQGKEVKIFKGHAFDVNSVAFSPDGNVIASGSSDNTVKLWNNWDLDNLLVQSFNWVWDYLK